jgi:hypothetical protein
MDEQANKSVNFLQQFKICLSKQVGPGLDQELHEKFDPEGKSSGPSTLVF